MSKATQLRQRAQTFLKKGKIEEAIEQYQKLLTVESRNPNLYNELGDIYLRAGEKMLAVSSFEKASANYEKVALYNNAVAVCKKILRTVPNRVETIYKLGEIKTKQKFMGEAEKYFIQFFDLINADQDSPDGSLANKIENILESLPDCECVWVRAAEAYSDMGIKSKAAETFAHLISKASSAGDSEKIISFKSRLDLLKKSLKPDEIDGIDKIASEMECEPVESNGLDPSGVEIVGNEAGIVSEDQEDSVEEETEIEAGTEDAVTGDAEPANDAEEEDLEDKTPGTAPEPEEYEIEAGSGEAPDPGIEDPEEGSIAEDGGGPAADPAIGSASGKDEPSATPSEDLSDIIEQEDKEIEKEVDGINLAEDITSDVEEDDFRSHYDLGMAYIEMRLFDDALKELQISSRSEHLRLQSLEMIGQCFIETDNPHLAVKQLNRGLELTGNANGDNLGIHYNLGLAYEALGDMEKAREHYEEVYIVDVTFRDISDKMKKLSAIS